MAGEEDIVPGKLAALEGNQWGPLWWWMLGVRTVGGSSNFIAGVEQGTRFWA